jgi:hypothetical protein
MKDLAAKLNADIERTLQTRAKSAVRKPGLRRGRGRWVESYPTSFLSLMIGHTPSSPSLPRPRHVTLNRPEVLNAINSRCGRALRLLHAVRDDPDVRVVIFQGG